MGTSWDDRRVISGLTVPVTVRTKWVDYKEWDYDA